jgi:hypothetical protein
MKNDKIEIKDVANIALILNLNPTISEMQEVVDNYENEANNDVTATWDLIVENLLYNYTSPCK